jgi:serine protease inhibitor
MMKRVWIAAVLVFALLVSGCAQTVLTGVGAGNLMAGIKANKVDPGDTAADTTEFALGLLKNTYAGDNTVVSPVSAYLALAMTANGASGATLREFEQVLGASLGELNDTGKLLLDAMNEASGVTLKAADGIWYNTAGSFAPSADFLQTNADYFGAAAYAADFSKQSAVDDINRYVSENTNGLIEKMLDQIDADIMILINTLYFKGDWASQFDPEDTTDARFTPGGGESVYTPTMKQEYDAVRYFESDGARGVILPYADARYAYVAILPDGDVSEYVSSLTADAFRALLDSASMEKVKLYMPRYEADGSYNLNDILKTMGLKQAFDPDKADFSAMGSAGSGNIYIDKVRQNIVFKLGETGTEAAAATSVEMALTALPIGEQQIELHLDRPFMYALMDMETMTPLFLGVLENPAA